MEPDVPVHHPATSSWQNMGRASAETVMENLIRHMLGLMQVPLRHHQALTQLALDLAKAKVVRLKGVEVRMFQWVLHLVGGNPVRMT